MKKKTETKKLIYIPALLALLVLNILLSASTGQVEIPLSDTFKILMERLFHVKLAGYAEIPSAYFNVVWMIRFPRALIAAAVGIGFRCAALSCRPRWKTLWLTLYSGYFVRCNTGRYFCTDGWCRHPAAYRAGKRIGLRFCRGAACFLFWYCFLPISADKYHGCQAGAGRYGHKLDVFGFFNIMIYFANNAQALQNITFWIMGSTASATWSKVPAILVIVALTALFS